MTEKGIRDEYDRKRYQEYDRERYQEYDRERHEIGNMTEKGIRGIWQRKV